MSHLRVSSSIAVGTESRLVSTDLEGLTNIDLEEDPGCGITQSWLQCFRTSEASFNAFLALSSMRFSHERGVKPLVDAPEKEIRALQAIAKQIDASPTTPTAGTMLAVALLANLQEYRGETTVAARHWKGLKSMVEVGGGVHRLRLWEELHNFLFWLDILICNASAVTLGQISTRDEYLDHCPNTAELFAVLTQVRRHPNFVKLDMEGGKDQNCSPVLQILLRSSTDRTAYAVTKSSRAKLACLIYFSLLELHFHKPRTKIPIYQAIEQEVTMRGQDRTIYSLELFYVILSMSNQDTLCHLIYKVSRLMSAAKNLERRDYNTCARLLSAFLGHRNPFEDVGEILSDWDDLSLRMLVDADSLMAVQGLQLSTIG